MMCAKGESPRLLEGSPHDEGISSPYHRLMWAADARQGSLPMPRFSLMQAAPAGSRAIPDRPSDKDHEEGKGKSSEDTWGQKWARFDTLRLPSWCFHSGIFWAFESYYHFLFMIIPPFLTICYSQHHQPNFLHHTIPLHALSRWCSSKGRRKVLMHRNVLSHNILLDTLLWPKKPISMKSIWCDLVTRYFWFGALAGKFGCRTGRAHSWGGYLGWFSTWKISMESSDTTAFQLGSNTATTEFGLIPSWSSWFGLGLCAVWKNSIPATSAFSLPEKICCIFVSSCFLFCLLFQVQDHGRNWMAGRTSAGGSRHLGTDGELQDF